MEYKKLILLFSASIVFLFIINYLGWWFFGSLFNFRTWYPHFGTVIWILKGLFLLVLGAIFIRYYAMLLSRNLEQIIALIRKSAIVAIFLLVVLLSLVYKNIHPFSNYPMYNSFPNYSYVFIIEDLNGKLLPYEEYTNYIGTDISDLYFLFVNKHKLASGYGQESVVALKEAGDYIGKKIKFKKKVKGFRLVRLHFKIRDKQMSMSKFIMYESFI